MITEFELGESIQKNELSPNMSYLLAFRLNEIKRMEKDLEERKEWLKQQMELRGIKKFDNEYITITYVEPTEKDKLNAQALKDAYPEIYGQFIEKTPVKSSVRIKTKLEVNDDSEGNV